MPTHARTGVTTTTTTSHHGGVGAESAGTAALPLQEVNHKGGSRRADRPTVEYTPAAHHSTVQTT